MQENPNTGRVVATIAFLIMAGFLSAAVISFMQTKSDRESIPLESWSPGEKLYPTVINQPDPMPMVDSGKIDHHGNPVMVRCNTCHSNQKPNMQRADASSLKQFHQGMSFQHTSLKCVSCHNPNDYETLRLADTTVINFSNVMQLCAQCHGPQYRDYKNGSHGGMKGHWDLSRGPRQRNNCVDCHDPHHPAYPKVMPVFPPKTRTGTTGSNSTPH